MSTRPHPTLTRRASRGRSTRARAALVTALSAALVIVAGCGTGDDAVVQGDTFQFVSPGGNTQITYDPPASRKKVADLSGEEVVSGTRIGLTDFTGQVVVINVWGQWCAPCRAEAPDLEQVYEENKNAGVAFLGINFRDNRQDAKDYIANQNLAYPSIFDYPGRTLVRLTTPTSVVPTTVVLDRYHRAAAVYLRTVSAEELDPLVKRLAAEPYTAQSAPSTARVPS
ncbi:TlpA family protein disulfide reductase [Williamsia phyllosphaerae]|uniref:Alkyl hydroperoxide reductase n=1 Tax=Williamsia phyllosphaerae TaxID=885042 RepID=A0ABQ1UQ33_9NOCA|nr:TlpA disulfide reductase family protein [Williamsia phyllosphaerae]GGF22547.1 alkyl hydroperoxide reductase [Williamsia phyllosphaerae]